MPVVLDVGRHVVVIGIRENERLGRLMAADGHCEQQVFVTDQAVAIAIEIGEVLDQLDAPTLENAQIKFVIQTLELATESKIVLATCPAHAVIPLQPVLGGLLRYTKRSAVGEAGEV